MHVFCDFDGTISAADTTDLILDRFAKPGWEAIEAEWEAGRIDAATCMRAQIGLIDAPLAAIDNLLDEVELTEGFPGFVVWLRANRIPLTIVSDGVDYFIRRVLARHRLHGLPVIANRLVPGASSGFRLMQPHRRAVCAGGSGVCKCAIVDAAAGRSLTVYIGDGRSDFCVSSTPDLLFATGRLADRCAATGIHHIPFTGFDEVRAALALIRLPSRDAVAA